MGTVAKVTKRIPALDTPEGRALLADRWAYYAYAAQFLDALLNEDDDEVLEAHADLNTEGPGAYQAVWSLLNSRERAAIKRILQSD